MRRKINPWVGKVSQTSEPNPFGGKRHYFQVAYHNGKKQSTKKAYFLEGDDGSKADAFNKATGIRNKLAKELNINLTD